MSFWLDDVTYVKKINGKPHLVRLRPDRNKSKSPSKDSSSSSNRNASQSQSRSNSSARRAPVEEVEDSEVEDVIPKEKFNKLQDSFDKLAELFTGISTTKTIQQPSIFDKPKGNMAGDDSKEAAKDDASNKSTSTENVTGNGASMLPPGFQAAPGLYTINGRTMALVPQQARSNTGFVGPNGIIPPGFGQPYMYGGGPGPMMGGMMMQPQPMGMGFGGFNSQFDKPQPVEVTQVNLATSITVTRHVCAGCGTLRSRRFQAENPLEPGEQPPFSYCRKCEKEIRSTDDEGDSSNERIKKKKSRRASYMKMPEPYVVVESVVVKEKHSHKHKEKIEDKKEVKAEDKAYLHTCAQCGRARSRKYQARHPIRKGETPKPGFCGKCQKEETSSEDSDASSDEEESKSSVSHERRSNSSRQFVSVPMVDARYADRVVTTKKVREPPPIKVVEEYSSSYDSAEEMPPPPRPHKTHKKKHSRNEKVITRTPAPIAVGNYLSNLIFGKKKYESVGEDLIVDHRHKSHRDHSEERSDRGRGRGRAESQSHHHRLKRHSIYEVPTPSPLIQETFATTETVPVKRRARSLDRDEKPHRRERNASHHAPKPHSPRRHRRYNDRGDDESYAESDGDTEDIAREIYKAYLSDGAPMHEESRHYNHHHEDVRQHAGPAMSHSESFDSSKFSEASAARRRERSASRPRGYASPPMVQEPHRPADPVLQRPPDEVIVTTERYVFKKPELPNSSRTAFSAHSESTYKDDRGERSSDISSRKSQKFPTHYDKAEYYPFEWSNNYGRGKRRESVSSRRESVSRPKVVVREEVHRERRQRREYEPHRDDSSSINAVPGSFFDTESSRSHDSYYSDHIAQPPQMIRHKANTESISTDRTSDYTTSSGSYSSKTTTSTERERECERYRSRGDVTPRNYHTPQVPGGYVSESEVSAASVRGRFDRDMQRARDRDRSRVDELERGRHRSRDRHHSPSPRRRSLTPAGYHHPSVSDASDDDTNSDHATAGVSRSRSNSRDRGRYRQSDGVDDPSELTANDRIRSRVSTRRKRRVSFGGKPDEFHTYSQVSLPTEVGAPGTPGTINTNEVLRDIEYVREVEHRREEERRMEAERRRDEERREDERRERRRRERAGERDELKKRSERERERQKDLDYGYASGRG